jgi:hypothetical protein
MSIGLEPRLTGEDLRSEDLNQAWSLPPGAATGWLKAIRHGFQRRSTLSRGLRLIKMPALAGRIGAHLSPQWHIDAVSSSLPPQSRDGRPGTGVGAFPMSPMPVHQCFLIGTATFR